MALLEGLFIALVVILGVGVYFYVKRLLIEVKEKKLDILTKHSWIAVRFAKDEINKDNKGLEKRNLALKILKKNVGGDEDFLIQVLQSSYQQMRGLI